MFAQAHLKRASLLSFWLQLLGIWLPILWANQYLGATLIPLAIFLTLGSNSMWNLESLENCLADHIGESWNSTNISLTFSVALSERYLRKFL